MVSWFERAAFRFCWRHISEGRMQAKVVVGDLEEVADGLASISDAFVLADLDLIGFESPHEPLAEGVVVRVFSGAHTRNNAMLFKDRDVVGRCVPTPAPEPPVGVPEPFPEPIFFQNRPFPYKPPQKNLSLAEFGE